MSEFKVEQNNASKSSLLLCFEAFLAQIEALVEAHLFRWVPGSKSDQKGVQKATFLG